LFDLLSNRSAVNCELVGVTRTKVRDLQCCFHDCGTRRVLRPEKRSQEAIGDNSMSLGLILVIILIIFLLGGFSGRFGYGYGHGGIGVISIILIIPIVLLLVGRL